MNRQQRKKAICQRIVIRINSNAPPGLGHWEPAWQMVAQPTDIFRLALNDFLDQDSEVSGRRLHEAADDLVRAWEFAARQFEALRLDPDEVAPWGGIGGPPK